MGGTGPASTADRVHVSHCHRMAAGPRCLTRMPAVQKGHGCTGWSGMRLPSPSAGAAAPSGGPPEPCWVIEHEVQKHEMDLG